MPNKNQYVAPFQPNILFTSATGFFNQYPPQFPIQADIDGSTTYGIGTPLPVSNIGTPVQNFLKFNGGTYSSLNDNTSITMPTFQILNCVISVRQAKNIVLTKVNGRNGTVKTYMGMDDYVIRVKGVLTSDNGIYPIDDANALLTRICTSPISIPISCPYLQRVFNINYVVIQGFEAPQEEGGYSNQQFELDLLSDDNSDSIITTLLKNSVNPYVTK